MKYSELIELPEREGQITNIQEGPDGEITAIAMIDGRADSWSEETLYFGYCNQLIGEFPPYAFLVGDAEAVRKEIPKNTGTSIAVVSPEKFGSVFNRIHDIIEQTGRNSFSRVLAETIGVAPDIGSIIEEAALAMGAALIFCDTDFRVICASRTFPIPDPHWADAVRKGYCDYEMILRMLRFDTVQKTIQQPHAFEVRDGNYRVRKMGCRVFLGEMQAGFLVLIDTAESYDTAHLGMLEVLGRNLGYAIRRLAPDSFKVRNHEHHFLLQLLLLADGVPVPKEITEHRYPDKMIVAFATLANTNAPMPQEAALKKALEERIGPCCLAVHEDGIVILGEENAVLAPDAVTGAFPEEMKVQVGLSRGFTGIADFRTAFIEAREALSFGKAYGIMENVFDYGNYTLFMIFRAASMREDLMTYVEPSLREIIEYDEKENAHLRETLQVFVMSGCSIKDTAGYLYLHRNTVIYRIRKIQELTGIDITDIRMRLRMLISFAIMDYLEKR